MIRDKIRDDKYFDEFLNYENNRIIKFTELIKKVIEQRGEEDKGARSGYLSLFSFHFNKLNAMFSAGKSISEIRDFLPDVIRIMQKVWNPESGYVQMLWIISLGITVEIEDMEFEKLKDLVKQNLLQDSLVDFLISYRCKDYVQSAKFKFIHPYKKLEDIFLNNNKQESVVELKAYLIKHWYHGHRDCGWYNSHKSQQKMYSGYWSFESAALVKVLGLNDEILKECQYYPYDLLHFKD